MYAFPDSVEKFYRFLTGTLSKLEICALTLGNFSVFFQKRICSFLKKYVSENMFNNILMYVRIDCKIQTSSTEL